MHFHAAAVPCACLRGGEVAVDISHCPLWVAAAGAGSQQEGWVPAAKQLTVPIKQVFCFHPC